MWVQLKHFVPHRVKPSLVMALWRLGLGVIVPGCQKLQMTNNQVWHRMLYGCTHISNSGRQTVKVYYCLCATFHEDDKLCCRVHFDRSLKRLSLLVLQVVTYSDSYYPVVVNRLPSFSGRYILGLAMTDVSGRGQLYWLVKESNVHLSLHTTPLSDVTDQSQQLCYVQAHAVSVTLDLSPFIIHSLLYRVSAYLCPGAYLVGGRGLRLPPFS